MSTTIAGAISGLANLLMWIPLSSHSSDGEARNIHPIIGIIMMILAPIAAGLIQMTMSRSREFEADAGGAQICGNPHWLANALIKLEQARHRQYFTKAEAHPATAAHLFIVNLINGEKFANLFWNPPFNCRARSKA